MIARSARYNIMRNTNILFFIVFGLLVAANASFAMVFDNRFIPLLQRPRLSVDGKQSSFAIDFFMATASTAIDENENEIGIPELHGKFDQATLAQSFIKTSRPNPLRSEWLGGQIPWNMEGKLQAQAFSFYFHQPIIDWLSVGFSWLFMRTNARQEFRFKAGGENSTNLFLGPGDLRELDDRRRRMFSDLGILGDHVGQLGFGDIDFYARFGKMWEYELKFRRIDAGLRLGLLIPSGVTTDIGDPASVPFGGDGHWGTYVGLDGLFELREDLKVGLLLRLNKRFARTTVRRMPALQEPRIFGTIVGPARVNPGVTFIFSPYLVLENLRKGLGLSVQYTLTSHQEDSWTDERLDKTVPAQLAKVQELSKWSTDYFTLNVFYDFGKMKVKRQLDPIVSFRWDVPSLLFITNNVPRTHRVSIGVEFAF